VSTPLVSDSNLDPITGAVTSKVGPYLAGTNAPAPTTSYQFDTALAGVPATVREGLHELVGLLSVILFGTIAMSLLGARLSRRIYNAARLIILLLGGLGLLLVLFPVALRTPAVGAGLFFGLIALFKLLGRFETAQESIETPPPGREEGKASSRS